MLLLIDLLVVALVVVIALILARVRRFEFEYEEPVPDALRARRARFLAGSAVRRWLDPFVVAFAALATGIGLESHRARVRRLLVRSGNPWGYTAEEFVGWSMTVAALTYTGVVAAFLLFASSFQPVLPVVLAALAYWLTAHGLSIRAETRRREVDRAIPFFLDLTSMSMDAGAGFTQAARTLVAEGSGGALEEEIAQALREMDAGVSLPDALKNLTRRSDSEELALLVQAVRQGQELGTPLARVFRDQAAMSRYRRTKRAEQAAGKLPNRLAVPTVFMMVAVMLLLFGPIVVRALRGGLGG
jgi:tight adherence protein C